MTPESRARFIAAQCGFDPEALWRSIDCGPSGLASETKWVQLFPGLRPIWCLPDPRQRHEAMQALLSNHQALERCLDALKSARMLAPLFAEKPRQAGRLARRVAWTSKHPEKLARLLACGLFCRRLAFGELGQLFARVAQADRQGYPNLEKLLDIFGNWLGASAAVDYAKRFETLVLNADLPCEASDEELVWMRRLPGELGDFGRILSFRAEMLKRGLTPTPWLMESLCRAADPPFLKSFQAVPAQI